MDDRKELYKPSSSVGREEQSNANSESNANDSSFDTATSSISVSMENEPENNINSTIIGENRCCRRDSSISRGSAPNGDLFVPVMCEFLEFAKACYQEINVSVEQMRAAFISCLKAFGTDPATSPDDFFGVFSKFLSSFSEVYRYLWQQKEDEERRQRTLTLTKRKSTTMFLHANLGMVNFRKKKADNMRKQARDSTISNGDFDQLISALQSGELFSDELNRLRSSFRRPTSKGVSEKGGAASPDDPTPSGDKNSKVEFRKKKRKGARPPTNSAPPYSGRNSGMIFDTSRDR